MADSTRGDPESPLLWTIKSTRTLAQELEKKSHAASHATVATLLKDADYSLQANRKTQEGTAHPDRNAQFQYINSRAQAYLKTGDPRISVDTKKKELIGNYKNNGQTWLPKSPPIEVNMHDFPKSGEGKAVPYGIYEIGKDRGYVNVGINHDTGEFAVASIRRWWKHLGQKNYPKSISKSRSRRKMSLIASMGHIYEVVETPVEKALEAIVENVTLQDYVLSAYPNPFWSGATSRFAGNPSTQIHFAMKEAGLATLRIYNLNGQLIRELLNF